MKDQQNQPVRGHDPEASEAVVHVEPESEELDVQDQEGLERKPMQGKLVTVTVDTKPHTVRKGRYLVSDFKRLVGVDSVYQLDEVVNGQFVELKDTEKVSIKGDEVFVSHVRGGAAS
jgi:hypothetical protein